MTDLERLKHLLEMLMVENAWNFDSYTRGLANGLILAISVIENREVEFLKIDGRYKSV